MWVEDHKGTTAALRLADQVQCSSFVKDSFLCIHRAKVWQGKITVRSTCAVERATEDEFVAAAS